MKVISDAAALNPGSRPVCAAIGVFDGVHLGHQSVLGQMTQDATASQAIATVVTFDKHPNAVVAPARVPALIYPMDKKLEVIAALGVEAAYVIPFDKAFSQISGEDFVRRLVGGFGQINSICVGDGFMFGAGRSGNVALLGKMGVELGFTLHAVRDVELDGQPVSSTRIREAVRAGDFALAERMLGRPYSLRGTVIQGEHLGRKLGFPTANMDVTGLLTPPPGVYVAEAQLAAGRFCAAVNIGHRPTIHAADPQLHVEAHLLDFAGEVYGQTLELVFLRKLRDEQKFPNSAALRAQIAKDIQQVRDYWTDRSPISQTRHGTKTQ